MEKTKLQKKVMNWMGTADTIERTDFLKIMIGMLNEEELKRCLNKVSRCRKVMKRLADQHKKAEIKEKRMKLTQSPSAPMRSARGLEVSGVTSTEAAKATKDSLPPLSAPLRPAQGLEATVATLSGAVEENQKRRGWWRNYRKKNIVAFDCEYVEYKDEEGVTKFKCGTVSIVDTDGNVILHKKVYHKPGSFRCDFITKQINGFNERSFLDGEDIEDVRLFVATELTGKLVIHFKGAVDFSCLNLNQGDFDDYDLGGHFKKDCGQKDSDDMTVYQTINLESIYYHFHGEKIQNGFHSCKEDAKATMKLFLTTYIQTKLNPETRLSSANDYDQFQNIVSIKKKFGSKTKKPQFQF